MRIAKSVLLLAALPLAVACSMSVPGVPGLPQRGASSGCAELVASALSSPSRPVAGSYACLGSELQASLQRATGGVSGDGALQQVAKTEPVYTSASPRGVTGDGSFVFVLDGTADGKPVSQVLLMRLDQSGHVAAISSAP